MAKARIVPGLFHVWMSSARASGPPPPRACGGRPVERDRPHRPPRILRTGPDAMSMMKKVKTGVPGFDVLTAGGIPAGRATLVVGRSGTGKTILGLQVACFVARN